MNAQAAQLSASYDQPKDIPMLAQLKLPDSRLEDLSERQVAALDAMLTEPTITKAAQKSGISRRTLSHWLNHSPVFRSALRDARTAALSQATARLQEAASDVAQRLIDIALDPNSGRRDAVQAGAKVLDMAYKIGDADEIERRIDEIERRLGDA